MNYKFYLEIGDFRDSNTLYCYSQLRHIRDKKFTHINYNFKSYSIKLARKFEILQTKLKKKFTADNFCISIYWFNKKNKYEQYSNIQELKIRNRTV